MPSLARIPMAVPAWEIASRAYSTWYRRPSGEKMVVCEEGVLVYMRTPSFQHAAIITISATPHPLQVTRRRRRADGVTAHLLGNRIFSTWLSSIWRLSCGKIEWWFALFLVCRLCKRQVLVVLCGGDVVLVWFVFVNKLEAGGVEGGRKADAEVQQCSGL